MMVYSLKRVGLGVGDIGTVDAMSELREKALKVFFYGLRTGQESNL